MNKTLSSKLMIQEKAYVDEKRSRIELEKRLNVAMSSQAAAGPTSDYSHEACSLEDLTKMRSNLHNVNMRV